MNCATKQHRADCYVRRAMHCRARRWWLVVVLLLPVACRASPARADDPSTLTGRPAFDRPTRLLGSGEEAPTPPSSSGGVFPHSPWPINGSDGTTAAKDMPGTPLPTNEIPGAGPNGASGIPPTDDGLPGGPPQFFSHPLRERLQPIRPPDNLSWLYRPISFGLFGGMMYGTTLIDDWIDQKEGYIGGIRLGWDCDEYWGLEARAAVGSIRLVDGVQAYAQRQYFIDQQQISADSPIIDRSSYRADYDLDVLYYFAGDRRWRPYFLMGAGLVQLNFDDLLGNHYSYTAWGMPLALGVKYHVDDRMGLRFEIGDEIVFSGGTGINVIHDVSLTAGLEFRFGGHAKNYWPWNPGTRSW